MQCLLNHICARFLLFIDWEELEMRIEMRKIGFPWRTQSPEFPDVNAPPLLLEVTPPPHWEGSSCWKTVLLFFSEGEILIVLLSSFIPLLGLSRPVTRACSHVNYEVKLEKKPLHKFAFFFFISRKLGKTCADRFWGCLTKEEKTDFQMWLNLLIWQYLPEVLDSMG